MARIQFSGNTITGPVWAGDWLDREHLLPGGIRLDPAQFSRIDAVTATVATGGAAQGATSVPVTALAGPIPSGTVLYFGGAKVATLTAAAAAGATSLTVAALPTALVAADAATYAGVGLKTVLSGTPVGRTFTERDAGTNFGPAVSTDDEVYLVAWDVTDVTLNADAEATRPGTVVKENYLPGWSTMATNLKTKLRAIYQTTLGAQ